jgi:periplasmic protein TonB
MRKQFRPIHRCAILFGLLVLLAGPGMAQLGRPQPSVLEMWQKRLNAAEAAVKAGQYKKARKDMQLLLWEMCDRIESGPGAAPLLATAALLRGLAEAGLGDEEAATWDWYVAQALFPSIAGMDLSRFGKLTETLKAAGNPGPRTVCDDSDVEPPVRIQTPPPAYPAGLSAACLQGTVVIQSVLGEDGVLRRPQLVESPGGPIMAFAALEAVRTWKLRPAQKQGKPVDAFYRLTVNFVTPVGCKPSSP